MLVMATEKNEFAVKKKILTRWQISQNKFACPLSQRITNVSFLTLKRSAQSWMI
jgi:hypothetical protein